MGRITLVTAVLLATFGISCATVYKLGCDEIRIKYGHCRTSEYDFYVPQDYIPFGTVVTCYCDPPYIWYGKTNRYTCGRGRYGWQWKPSDFGRCVKPKYCSVPKQPNGGYYRPQQKSYSDGDKIVYKCNNGFYLSNPKLAVRRCTSSGEWDRDAPLCLPKCKRPAKPGKGSFSPYQDYYDVHATTTFTCDKYYELDGEKVLTCKVGGRWNYPSPSCRPTCPYRKPPSKGSVSPAKKRYSVNDVITFSCNDKVNYYLYGNPKDKCKSNGKWEVNNTPKCYKKCRVGKLAPKVQYTPRDDYYRRGAEINFSCSSKEYELVGERKSTCKSDGSWDKEFPVCVRKCYRPKVKNGGVDEDDDDKKREYYLAGEYIEYFCNKGYVLKEDKEGQCQKDGTWSFIATCLPLVKKCFHKPVKGLGIRPGPGWYSAGSTVKYYCRRGYQLTGKYDYNKCQSDGTWRYDIPSCQEKKKEGSCYKRCHNRYDYFGYDCQCDYLCEKKGTCCGDYRKYCKPRYIY